MQTEDRTSNKHWCCSLSALFSYAQALMQMPTQNPMHMYSIVIYNYMPCDDMFVQYCLVEVSEQLNTKTHSFYSKNTPCFDGRMIDKKNSK